MTVNNRTAIANTKVAYVNTANNARTQDRGNICLIASSLTLYRHDGGAQAWQLWTVFWIHQAQAKTRVLYEEDSLETNVVNLSPSTHSGLEEGKIERLWWCFERNSGHTAVHFLVSQKVGATGELLPPLQIDRSVRLVAYLNQKDAVSLGLVALSIPLPTRFLVIQCIGFAHVVDEPLAIVAELFPLELFALQRLASRLHARRMHPRGSP